MVWQQNLNKHISIRFSQNGKDWSNWKTIEQEEHSASQRGRQVSRLSFSEAANQFFQIKLEYPQEQLEIHFFSPGKTGLNPNTTKNVVEACTQPSYRYSFFSF